MMKQPKYFEAIRAKASTRWDQLESDPELAGPWHQLFKQVQSPRHVLSELLQNADDAGATKASVRIDGMWFIFEHNGEDFSEAHFQSLCRFGYSNKRSLHTIGFRGIGFKSIFSLGPTVHLRTKTLNVRFEKKRFTEPIWTDSECIKATQVSVEIENLQLKQEVEKNLVEWTKSSYSLLFFQNIRRLQVNDLALHWKNNGPGPVPNTEWAVLAGDKADSYLVVRSEPEPFPPEAIEEINQERMMLAEAENEYPPCRVELVVGAKGRLYVVLPTGVETDLPFGCNAPFIQDPARLKIKDPETSPTNRWLLQRIGALAATVMLDWINNLDRDESDRARAYNLMPDVDRDDNTLEGVCAAATEISFAETVKEKPVVLCEGGEVAQRDQCVVLPEEIFAIWPGTDLAVFLEQVGRNAVSRHVTKENRGKLEHWKFIHKFDRSAIITLLQTKRLPCPKPWARLLALWAFINPELDTSWKRKILKSLKILPDQSKDVLYSANEVIRLSEKKQLQTESDWEFLTQYARVLNSNLPGFISDQRRVADKSDAIELRRIVEIASSLLHYMELDTSTDVDEVIAQVSTNFFAQSKIIIADCVRLAQIAANLNAVASQDFKYVDTNRSLNELSRPNFQDIEHTTEALLPEAWLNRHQLHSAYAENFTSCTREVWIGWVASGKSGIVAFPPLNSIERGIRGASAIENSLKQHGLVGNLNRPYVTNHYVVSDWDFDSMLWSHWNILAQDDDKVWARIIEAVLAQPIKFWWDSQVLKVFQVATTGSRASTTYEKLTPSWILKFREIPCLRDTRGQCHKPSELMRRTPETEALIEVEPFLDAKLDTAKNRPLLDCLGVSSTPTGPDKILKRLQALAAAPHPPVDEVEKWYRRLDGLAASCSTEQIQTIKQAFVDSKLILDAEGHWVGLSGVFLTADELDAPGAALIPASLRDLTFWRKIGVAERPTIDLAINWLRSLPVGSTPSQDDVQRIRALKKRHPIRIWEECGHWLNLAGKWAPTSSLCLSLSSHEPIVWQNFHPFIKESSADLQGLPMEVLQGLPFNRLSSLASVIEERIQGSVGANGRVENPNWLRQFGELFLRFTADDMETQARIRSLAAECARSKIHWATVIEVVPYIRDAPAGTARETEAAWKDGILHMKILPRAKAARIVPATMARLFGDPDIASALSYCFERTNAEIAEYVEENFHLAPAKALGVSAPEPTKDAGTATDITPGDTKATAPMSEPRGDLRAENEEDTYSATRSPEREQEHEPIQGDLSGDSDPETMGSSRGGIRKNLGSKQKDIMEVYGLSWGFRLVGEGRLLSEDGRVLLKSGDEPFTWQQINASGDIIRYYWSRKHCLQQEPLQMPADVWGLLNKFPNEHAVILLDSHGKPVEISGVKMREMLDKKSLKLYPASYRLVHE